MKLLSLSGSNHVLIIHTSSGSKVKLSTSHSESFQLHSGLLNFT